MGTMNATPSGDRRRFLRRLLTASGLAAAAPQTASPQSRGPNEDASRLLSGSLPLLPAYTRAQNYKSLKQSSFDRTGGNRDAWNIPAGGTQTVFEAAGPGIVSHIWFTIAARSG